MTYLCIVITNYITCGLEEALTGFQTSLKAEINC